MCGGNRPRFIELAKQTYVGMKKKELDYNQTVRKGEQSENRTKGRGVGHQRITVLGPVHIDSV